MFAISFIYIAFFSHLSYVILERRENVYKDSRFWLLVIALLLTVHLTIKLLF